MKKLLAAGAIALALGGCAQLQTAWDVVTGTSIPPTAIIVAANSFDAAEASATQYLGYCKANPTSPACAAGTKANVIAGVRAGRAVRNQLEPYITNGSAGPAALYNSLVAAVTSIQSSIPAGASK